MIEIPELLKSKKLGALDGLRGVSILFVIFSHFIFYSDLNKNLNFGGIGVDIFFVISGFLITTLLLKEKLLNGRISLKDFYIRRALRILPVVILFLAILLCINAIFKLQIPFISFLASILFIRNLPIPNTGDWYTAHFWSLGVEEQFYLLFPFLLARMNINVYKKTIVILIVLITVLDYLFYNKIGVFYSNHLVHILTLIFCNVFGRGTALILTGSLLSVLMFTKSKFIMLLSQPGSRLLSIIIFVIAIMLQIHSSVLYVEYFSELIFAILIGIIIILNLNGNNYMSRFLNTKLLAEIGILSYSLYLWQQIFTNNQPWRNTFKYSNSVLFNLPILFIIGFLSYYFYERKFLKWKNRFKRVEKG